MHQGSVSVHSARSVIHKVGSFLGVSEEHSLLDLWHERLDRRAQSGELGLHLFHKANELKFISELERAVLQASTCNLVRNIPPEGYMTPMLQPTLPALELLKGAKYLPKHVLAEHCDTKRQEYGTGAESDTIVMSTLAAEQRPVGPHGPVQTASTPTLLSPVVMPPEVKEILTSVLSGSSESVEGEIDRARDEIQNREVLESPSAGGGSPTGRRLLPGNMRVDSSQSLEGEEAYENYMICASNERQKRIVEMTRRKEHLEKETLAKLERLKNAMDTVKSYYISCYKRRTKTCWEQVRDLYTHTETNDDDIVPELPSFFQRSSTTHEMPRFHPYFTYVICIISFLAFAIAAGINKPLADVGVEPTESMARFSTFRGSEAVVHWAIPNVWIGSTVPGLIHSGAVYAPCMRDDIQINTWFAAQGAADFPDLGCCEVNVAGRKIAGTTSRTECERDTGGMGHWTSRVPCSERNSARAFEIEHKIKPCCVGIKGQCRMVVKAHCDFLEGVFFDFGPENCRQVNCLKDVCGFSGMDADPTQQYKPKKANQQWRYLLAVLVYPGILQVVLVIFLHFVIGQELEVVAGWLRTAIIYFFSAIGGLAMGAAFTPYLPHTGAVGGIFGELAALMLELMQSWKLVRHPWLELLKMLGIIGVFLFMGSLPLMDNWEIVGGLVFGILVSIVVLPYITFGKWDVIQKKILIAIAIPIIVLLYAFVFYLMYDVQNVSDKCASCRNFNCALYTDLGCEIENLV